MVFTNEEAFDMIMIYGEFAKHSRNAARAYAERYPDREHPSHMYFQRLAHRLRTTGSVQPLPKRPREFPVRNEAAVVDVLAAVAVNPRVSTRRIARERAMSHSTVHRVLRTQKFHPYHISLHKALAVQDHNTRLRFCQWATARHQQDAQFFKKVLWSDEATFKSDGNVNRHNLHYWSVDNPHWMREVNHQVRWSVNVWCGIIGCRVIGPYYFDGNLNGDMYRQFLVDDLPTLLEDVSLAVRNSMWFQQDGCPAHFRLTVRAHLNNQYPGRWIGRGGPINWPARSPDLTPLDFFLWGRLKDLVYFERPTTVEDIRVRISQACREINPAEILRVQQSFIRRLQSCIDAGGQQFEHL